METSSENVWPKPVFVVAGRIKMTPARAGIVPQTATARTSRCNVFIVFFSSGLLASSARRQLAGYDDQILHVYHPIIVEVGEKVDRKSTRLNSSHANIS